MCYRKRNVNICITTRDSSMTNKIRSICLHCCVHTHIGADSSQNSLVRVISIQIKGATNALWLPTTYQSRILKRISFRPQFKVHGFIELICNHFTCAAEIVNWICSRKFYQRDLVVKFKLDLTYKKDNECYRMDQIYVYIENGFVDGNQSL